LEWLLENDRLDEPSHEGHRDMETQSLMSNIKEHMNKLKEEEQNLITMRYLDDLDPREIAEITGMNVNNVSVKIHRAIKSLQKHI
jgi:RNA polymerase sigma factor (sigma-70 family)